MIGETAKRLSQLVEINRALAQDLDVSRRQVADLGRERDSLQKQLEERDDLVRQAEFAESRADQAEEHLRALLAKYREVERERVELRRQLDESTEFLGEIRHRLAGLPDEERFLDFI